MSVVDRRDRICYHRRPLDYADVRVIETSSDALVVEAHDATVQQVIEALRASHKIEVMAPAELSRVITGTYSGTLLRVLARALSVLLVFLVFLGLVRLVLLRSA